MRIDAPWLSAAPVQRALGRLTGAGHEAFVVGGCVRNALLGVPVADVDIATSARPEAVMALAGDGIKAVPTGIEHGTVTLVIDGQPLEVTTYRADVETDGRRAVVRFSDTLEEDAARRDFTMNALYADASGEVHDPLGGLPDLLARRVRFVGDAATRLAEDYLRALRFFRFAAWYGDPDEGLDAEALAAIAADLDGLDRLSRERVGHEMRRLLAAPDPAPAVAAMAQTGVLARLLPGTEARVLPVLAHLEEMAGLAPDPIRRLAALGPVSGDDLRLSRAEARQLEELRGGIGSAEGIAEIGYRHGAATARDVALLRAAVFETPLDPGALRAADQGAGARFPLAAKDLMPALEGAALGAELRRLEAAWIASGFTLDRAGLLAMARR
ncbi:CCA tRNA nucleotidyltransferase [Litorisediminicola beolgyonensis]|uniref:CCA tRNA nucleotidyltransferase n=1 Tax=Litorisediminicola beolgyonensis TaxID=1173614 RepID=A0ABW3ZLT2_9RHOB